MVSSPFLVSIGELNPNRVTGKPVEITATPAWEVELSRLNDDPPVMFSGELTLTSGGLVVRGRATASVRHTCSRCLTEWDAEVGANLAQLIVRRDSPDHDDEDYLYSGDIVDLEPVLRDELLLALPLLPTCPDGCKQLVEEPNSDLNAVTPNDSGESVSPFAVLKDLLDHE